jgi:carbonic anhydrase/acetyltransferase-like protein (isoleucine patch superfamily)
MVSGDVMIEPGSRVLAGAVLNADRGPIRIGSDVVIMEQAVLRAARSTR